ncbi:hypothetical protein BGW39_001118 [Mortierella sp. 14UC]|nr:hypothetical protein BGW39_001118 [Mortierella sp. 14UC]
MNPSPSMCKKLLVLYFNEITSLQRRERVHSRSLSAERICFSSGITETFFRTYGQRANRIDIRGIRLDTVHLIAKTSSLLRVILLHEPERQVNVEAIDWNRELVKLYSEAYEVLMKC